MVHKSWRWNICISKATRFWFSLLSASLSSSDKGLQSIASHIWDMRLGKSLPVVPTWMGQGQCCSYVAWSCTLPKSASSLGQGGVMYSYKVIAYLVVRHKRYSLCMEILPSNFIKWTRYYTNLLEKFTIFPCLYFPTLKN